MSTEIAALPARSSPQNNQRIKSWYPTANLLQLPYVPEEAKEQVRRVVAPALTEMKANRIPIEQGKCWRTSQTLAMLAKSPRVKYVEGVWLGGCGGGTQCNCGGALRHAWNLVDGYVVDLSEELYFRKEPNFAPEREPHTVFTFEEVMQHHNDHTAPPTGIISLDKWLLHGGFATLPAHLKTTVGRWGDKELAEVNELNFSKTTMRLRNRLREEFRGVKSA